MAHMVIAVWLRLMKITEKSRRIAKEGIPIITDIPFDKLQLDGNEGLVYLTSRLIELLDGLVFSDAITFDELAQNNFEFLDTLKTTLTQIHTLTKQQPFSIVDEKKLEEMQVKIHALVAELSAPPFLQHRKRTPEDTTEPHRKHGNMNIHEHRFHAGRPNYLKLISEPSVVYSRRLYVEGKYLRPPFLTVKNILSCSLERSITTWVMCSIVAMNSGGCALFIIDQ